ncbi:phosphate ABC transporter permease PstA [Oceanospirillum linum]|uniref:Phosphate transport system permease protein PstA n=1 Tax=Oceanospirillum linum TaxID=966 RepID=A0A1T1HC10_OCELI|nr:phosphate ABC transporter permease PstA [Oceanospirillum linum]OOV87342.1 phosphate ABC transporter, permease protein PstA [Oceanospirillum linum]SEF82052.1 phosphate transport system permease protein [Oleiphilus messinensis]SMP19186.1 phosphate transport system permease protein [Oceanospirillum linum]
MRESLGNWTKSGSPWIWLNAGAVAISVIMVIGLLALIAVRGLGHFWPASIMEADVRELNGNSFHLVGEKVETVSVPVEQIRAAGIEIDTDQELVDRHLIKIGNRDVHGTDFRWVLEDFIEEVRYPENLIAVERHEWGNFYGYLLALKEKDKTVAVQAAGENSIWPEFKKRVDRAVEIHDEIYQIEKHEIGRINYAIERLRLKERRLEIDGENTPENLAELNAERSVLNAEYEVLQQQLADLYTAANRDSFVARAMNGQEIEVSLSKVVRVYQPNRMDILDKMGFYSAKLWEFASDDPREANTEGGIFPAIFGTVMMVLLMSVLVTPFGVIAAVYLREYAKQGFTTRMIRIAVNNLAGVPSVVYGVFGLGFFIYFLGGNIDQLFFPEALPAPTFGTPGLMWASLTLALLTVPVVIVATEEGLARIPRSVREGSLALGATKAETLWRVVLPMASPAMMTGVILAVARAAGEVAPLMLVGVVKLAPSLPLDGNYPFIHLDQKFMHLGFHIYDVGFQSPNVEAARPLVYATALLLVIVIALLNFSAVAIRNHLREKYKSLEM